MTDPSLTPSLEALIERLQQLRDGYRSQIAPADWARDEFIFTVFVRQLDGLLKVAERVPSSLEALTRLKALVKRMRTHGTAGQRIVKRWSDELEDATAELETLRSDLPSCAVEALPTIWREQLEALIVEWRGWGFEAGHCADALASALRGTKIQETHDDHARVDSQ